MSDRIVEEMGTENTFSLKQEFKLADYFGANVYHFNVHFIWYEPEYTKT